MRHGLAMMTAGAVVFMVIACGNGDGAASDAPDVPSYAPAEGEIETAMGAVFMTFVEGSLGALFGAGELEAEGMSVESTLRETGMDIKIVLEDYEASAPSGEMSVILNGTMESEQDPDTKQEVTWFLIQCESESFGGIIVIDAHFSDDDDGELQFERFEVNGTDHRSIAAGMF